MTLEKQSKRSIDKSISSNVDIQSSTYQNYTTIVWENYVVHAFMKNWGSSKDIQLLWKQTSGFF